MFTAIDRDDRVALQGAAATPDTQRPGGHPPALGESHNNYNEKPVFFSFGIPYDADFISLK